MPLVSEQELLEGVRTNDVIKYQLLHLGINPDRDDVFKQLEALVKRGGNLRKSLRPWDINPRAYDHLDRDQPWWGWEFETGWRSDASKRKAIAHAWDNFDGVMFDGEGDGAHAVEITFMPSEMSTYMDGSAPALRFMEWVDANKAITYSSGGVAWGIHLNFSDKRMANNAQNTHLSRFLKNSLESVRIRNGMRKEMFGREVLYGTFYPQDNGHGSRWIECKGFNATYSLDEFKRYVKTAHAIQKAVDVFFNDEQRLREGLSHGVPRELQPAITNLYDVYNTGAKPIVGMVQDIKVARGAAPLFSRPWG